MKKFLGFAGVGLASALIFGGIQGTANANTGNNNSKIQQQDSWQTKQGDRPFGGIPPKGMNEEEYSKLENNVPNPNEVSPEKYNQAVEREVVRIANEDNKTIYLPQGVVKPGIPTDKSQDNNEANTSNQLSSKESNTNVLPSTGEENSNDAITLGVGLASLLLGISMFVVKSFGSVAK
ncbi:TPA: LPXTG cell wall anchor domain-containing protein [Staphylococcus aureus]|jgi:LPXTG-motif cell wall-anchored protein|uniref:LPXTG cell wall anchor domain-containing protein n=1 Tax=Staphylococcus haemolyticus TaxID=1283 RepID=UPI00075B079E|nr:LPXTG cell wall anchor domain-containing protein [Staphylococcus haemolyticus]MCH4477465.1 LPXTG cell wall anchor domain-containing protein [Staphylococcus haemolyticus]HCY7565865.1 LPXTG cell wall anchor domain-containing protein [Staphylococcus aureus]HCY8037601.1 LPXTG cell wall anchor domain-containing protein [Staphylococcus aureus]